MILNLEVNKDFVEANTALSIGNGTLVVITPPLNEDYWIFRVKLHADQAILGFPKFGTIGIGFAQEEDWNTNLPYTCDVQQIFDHIKHNKKYDAISDENCINAIQIIKDAATKIKEQANA